MSRYQDIHSMPDLPDHIPVMPLHGVLLLPRGQLPLNIFEKRYLEMVEDAMKSQRLIGIIQPDRRDKEDTLFTIGCAGKITGYEEKDDGRYLITLTGICRFRVVEELPVTTEYRQVAANWSEYLEDLSPPVADGFDRKQLLELLENYFRIHDMKCSREHLEKAPPERLINCLSMICPLEPFEKQVLLEAEDSDDRAVKLMAMLEIAVKCGDGNYCSGKSH